MSKYKQSEADRINKIFSKEKLPFRADCNKNDELTFYKILESCNGEKTTRISETALSNYLIKNTDYAFKSIVGRVPERIKHRDIKVHKCPEQKPCPECKEPEPCPEVTHVKTLNITTNKDIDILPIVSQKAKRYKSPERACGVKHVKNMILGDCAEINTSGDILDGRYGIINLDNIIVSHNPVTFAKNSKYPNKCQEREYHSNSQLQNNVVQRAKNLDARFLINDAPTAEDGPPIVDYDGVVLGGNSRGMMLMRASEKHPTAWKSYQLRLKERLHVFGFNYDDIKHIKNPVLVRVFEAKGDKCSHYSRILNTSLKNETDDLSLALSLAKYIKDKELQEIGEMIEADDAETLSEIFQKSGTQSKIIEILKASKVINETNITKFLSEGKKFTDTGRALVEKILIACILEERQYVESCKSYTNKILKNIPYFIKAKAYPKEWNYIPSIKQAIQFEDIRSNAGMTKKTYLAQQAMFEKNPPSKMDLTVWNLLDLTQPKLKYALVEYDKLVKNQTSNDDAFFEVEKVKPEDGMSTFIDGRKIKINSLSDKKKARGHAPLPKQTTFFGKVIAWVKKDLRNFL